MKLDCHAKLSVSGKIDDLIQMQNINTESNNQQHWPIGNDQ